MEDTQHEGRMLETFSLWGTAYAITQGIRLVRTVPGNRCSFVLDDTGNQATAALTEWRLGNPMVAGRSLVEVQRELMSTVRNTNRY